MRFSRQRQRVIKILCWERKFQSWTVEGKNDLAKDEVQQVRGAVFRVEGTDGVDGAEYRV